MFYLILLGALGAAILNEEPFSSKQECQEAGKQYSEMLAEQRSDDRHNAMMGCVQVPAPTLQPRELWKL